MYVAAIQTTACIRIFHSCSKVVGPSCYPSSNATSSWKSGLTPI